MDTNALIRAISAEFQAQNAKEIEEQNARLKKAFQGIGEHLLKLQKSHEEILRRLDDHEDILKSLGSQKKEVLWVYQDQPNSIPAEVISFLDEYPTIGSAKAAGKLYPREELGALFPKGCDTPFTWYGMVHRGARERRVWRGCELNNLLTRGLRRRPHDVLNDYYGFDLMALVDKQLADIPGSNYKEKASLAGPIEIDSSELF